MNRHPPEKDKSDRNIDDTYVYDSASGLYKPQSHENEEERREKRRGRNSRLPFFANVRRDWLTIFFSAVTLVVVGAYTYYAKGQWHEMIRAANAAMGPCSNKSQWAVYVYDKWGQYPLGNH